MVSVQPGHAADLGIITADQDRCFRAAIFVPLNSIGTMTSVLASLSFPAATRPAVSHVCQRNPQISGLWTLDWQPSNGRRTDADSIRARTRGVTCSEDRSEAGRTTHQRLQQLAPHRPATSSTYLTIRRQSPVIPAGTLSL